MSRIYIANVNCLNDDELFNQGCKLVSASRIDKINSFLYTKDRNLSLGAELLLRKCLYDENLISYDDELKFDYNAYNKPSVSNLSIKFNIAHSSEYVVCAISNNEIGVDIELIKEAKLDVAKRCFHNDEYTNVLMSNDMKDIFYRYWTLKESFSKAVGDGIALPLNSYCIKLSNNITVEQNFDSSNYFFKEYDVDKYKCAVCSRNIEFNEDLRYIDLKDVIEQNKKA